LRLGRRAACRRATGYQNREGECIHSHLFKAAV
jgi:hypothetical protein